MTSGLSFFAPKSPENSDEHKVAVELFGRALESCGIEVAGLDARRDLGVTLEVSRGMHIIDTDPQGAAFALVGGNRGERR